MTHDDDMDSLLSLCASKEDVAAWMRVKAELGRLRVVEGDALSFTTLVIDDPNGCQDRVFTADVLDGIEHMFKEPRLVRRIALVTRRRVFDPMGRSYVPRIGDVVLVPSANGMKRHMITETDAIPDGALPVPNSLLVE